MTEQTEKYCVWCGYRWFVNKDAESKTCANPRCRSPNFNKSPIKHTRYSKKVWYHAGRVESSRVLRTLWGKQLG